ncbi:hypothetical protein [Nautilia sp. PV-1]|nr:hypothetical protein [Nautilia sp. PV-1]
MDFDKFPMANHYNEYPFLMFENIVNKEKCIEIIDSLEKETYKAKLIG